LLDQPLGGDERQVEARRDREREERAAGQRAAHRVDPVS